MRNTVALALALAPLVSGSCAPVTPNPVDFTEAPRAYAPDDYPKVLRHWTRHDKVSYHFDTALEAWATFKSWDFREAYVAHYGAIYGLSEADRDALRASQREATQAAYEFHVTVQSARFAWNDLDKKTSPWRISLIDGGGGELLPESVRLQKLPDAYEAEFFPDRTPFTRSYLVRFARPQGQPTGAPFVGPHTGRIALRIAGPIGLVKLVWQAE